MNIDELKIVLKAGIAMAQKDGKFDKQEAELIEHLLQLGGLTLLDVGGFDELIETDPEQAVVALKSVKAKRTYMLTLACVAMADKQLDPSELAYFKDKALKLEVGTIDLEQITYEKAVSTLERIIGEIPTDKVVRPEHNGPQPSDIDLM